MKSFVFLEDEKLTDAINECYSSFRSSRISYVFGVSPIFM